ncbi:MAG: two-component regulator propeller domain-containing protein [Tahibacter sp.]
MGTSTQIRAAQPHGAGGRRPVLPWLLAAVVLGAWSAPSSGQSAASTPASGIPAAVDAAESIRFRSYDQADGLSDRNVRAVTQDRDGFLWVGTQNGLDRFDGSTFRVFRHVAEDVHSLPDNYVMALSSTADGVVWVGTAAGGLGRFDPDTDRFQTIRAVPPLRCRQVRALYADRAGTLWASCFGEGIARLDATRNQLVAAPFEPVAGLEGVRVIIETARGDLLFAAQQLWRWDPRTLRPVLVPLPTQGVDRFEPHALLETAEGELWIGLISDGLLRLRADGSLIRHYRGETLPGTELRGLLQARNREIWISTTDGIGVFSPATQTFLQRRVDREDPTAPPKHPGPLIEDRDGLIWVTSRLGGLGVHDPDTRALRLYRQRGTAEAALPRTAVEALVTVPDHSLWLGLGDSGGLVHFSTQRGVLAQYRHDPRVPGSLASNDVPELARSADGTLWIGNATEGLDRLPPGDSQFAHFRVAGAAPAVLPSDLVEALHVDGADTVWIALDGGGLASRCATCTLFRQRLVDRGPQLPSPGGTTRAVASTLDGTVWAGTLSGAVRLRPSAREPEYFQAQPAQPGALRHDIVTAIHVDRSDRVWFATAGGGLQQAMSTSAQLPFIDPAGATEIADTFVQCIEDAADGALWLASTDLLRRFDPHLGTSRVAFAGHYSDACGRDGNTLYFGGSDGLLAFDAADVPAPRAIGPVLLSELWLFNLRVPPKPEIRDTVLSRRLADVGTLVLDYRQSVFGFSFAAIEFRDPASVRYRYRLEGLHEDWLPLAQAQRFVSFSHVPPGSYVFRVEASRGDSRSEAHVGVRVLPAPWRSNVAYATYAALLFGLLATTLWRAQTRLRYERSVSAAIRRSEEQLRLLNEELESRVASRTADLTRANGELGATLERLRQAQRQLVESEKMASLGGLVAGVAHEINTPLGVGVTAATHLRGETEHLRKRLASGELSRSDLDTYEATASASAELIVRNLRRAADLVRTFRELAVDEVSDQVRVIELGRELHELLTILAPALPSSRHRIVIDCPTAIEIQAPAGALHRILTILVTNALQHAFGPEQVGCVTLAVRRDGAGVVLSCNDDGIGMESETRERVFEPFFTTRRHRGAMGLGLHIAYNLVTQVLRGTIRCDSAPGHGCRVEIRWDA